MSLTQTVTTELYLDGAWTDISTYVYLRDSGVQVTRGRTGEDAAAGTSTCLLTLNNRDGRFSPRNPSGAYYGLIGRNTPIRVSVSPESAGVAPTYVAAGTASSGTLAEPGMPAGVGSGDTLLMLTAASQGVTLAGYPVTDDTWTLLAESVADDTIGAAGGNLRLFGKPYNAADPATEVISGAGGANVIAQISAFNDLPLAGAGSIHALTTLTSAGGNIAYPALSITQDGCVALVCGWLNDDWTSVAALAGMTEIGEPDQAGSPGQGIVWDYVIQTTAADITAGEFTVTGGTFGTTQGITIALTTSAGQTRFTGYVSEWPVDWDVTGEDSYVQIEANGAMRRLDQGDPPAYSALRRAITAIQTATGDVLAYWPLEDDSGSTTAASALGDGRPLVPRGPVPGFGSSEAPAGSANSVSFDGTQLVLGHVSNVATNTAWSVEFWFRGETGDSDWGIFPVRWQCPQAAVALGWRVNINSNSNTAAVIADDGDSPATFTTVASASMDVDDDTWHYYLVTAEASGGNVDIVLYVDGVNVASGTRVGANLRNIRSAVVGLGDAANTESQGQLCHLAFYAGLRSPTTRLQPGAGYAGEPAGTRIKRLAVEDNVSISLSGSSDASVRMGPQPAADLMTLLTEIEATDAGILYEPRDDFDLGYRTVGSLYNQIPRLDLDYASHEMTRLGPVEDDRYQANDVTATREGGGSARLVLTSGPLSTQAPGISGGSGGIGSYPTSISVNPRGDDQLEDAAGWRLHIGTVDQPRYPALTLDLGSSHLTGLLDSIRSLDVGDRLRVTNPPAGQGAPETIDLILQGYIETFSKLTHQIQLNCSPASPYNIGNVAADDATDATVGISRYDTEASAFLETIDSTDTTVAVGTSIGPGWTTDAADLPFDILVEGERITVTNVTGPTQGARFVGVGAGQSLDNASLTALGLPANAVSGDLVLIFASIRTTTATVATPGSWTLITDFGGTHAKIFGRIYNGVWTMPTVTFSGGAAGADTIGQVCAFRSVLLAPDATSSQSNASAQNIATPALDVTPRGRMVIWAGWKQDDWTSAVHVNGLATEINERTGTAGNDAGQIWAYRYFDPATDIGASSFTVTGGVSAVSRGATLALNDVQEFTMTRSVNGVVAGHSSSTPIALFDPDYWGL